MTSYGPPSQPYPPPGYGYGQPQQQPAPPVGAPPPFPLWPVIVVTVFFSLFGLIPTILGSNRASQRREDSSRYWIAFVLSLLGAFVLYAIVVIVMVFVVFASTVAVVGNAIQSLPTYSPSPFATSTTTSGATGATTGPCQYTPAPGGANVTAAPLPDDPAVTPTDTRTWTLVTSAGTIVVELDGAAAPCTVQSIVSLTEYGFYDDTPCPRAVDSGIFVLQCGDPSGTTAGGPGYTFADENLANADYSAGTVAMANSGPDTNGSQFFLIDKDANTTLSKAYTAFGTITTGLDVLDKIVAAGNDGSNPAGGGAPKTPVDIVSATIS